MGAIGQRTLRLYDRFEARTLAPDRYKGFYKNPDTGKRVDDESRRYIVAIPEDKVESLREVLRTACDWFKQKCIYLSVAGRVEFIKAEFDEKK